MDQTQMDKLTVQTLELETQYNNHIKRLDSEFSAEVNALKLQRKTDLEELAQKELAQKDKLSFSKFFKIDKKDDKEEDKQKESKSEVVEEKMLTDEEKLELRAKRREEEKLNKNKKPKKEPTPKAEEVKKVSKKEQAIHDKYKVDLKATLEKFNFKCDDVHVLFVEKIIELEKSYGVTVVRTVEEPKKFTE